MNARIAKPVLILFTLAWGCWVGIEFFASALGDCLDNQLCRGAKPFMIPLTLWRGLAVELAAILLYILVRKR